MEAMGKMKSYKEQNENKQVVGAIKYVQIAREERTDDFPIRLYTDCYLKS